MTATNICYNFVGFRCSPPLTKDCTGEHYLTIIGFRLLIVTKKICNRSLKTVITLLCMGVCGISKPLGVICLVIMAPYIGHNSKSVLGCDLWGGGGGGGGY